MATTFTRIEQEAIVLGAVMGMIDEMVNHAIFCPLGEKRNDTNLLPKTSETLRQFSTLLRDFLSPVTARGKDPLPFGLDRPEDGNKATEFTTLFYLRQICGSPLIGTEIAPLKSVVRDFAGWLEEIAFVPRVWLSNIEVEVDLRIKRIDFIRISGDIGKHNFLRLRGQTNRLCAILLENGITIDESDAYLALPDCWDWFHTHLLAYHASNIAEYLNNIRYGIRAYIEPVAKARYRITDSVEGLDRYTFERPDEIMNKFAWAQYFELLQGSLREPYFPQFSVSRSFKSQF
ncbi:MULTISPECIES: hypothetical protein [unclassified Sphingopyxis]|uniref:hypothetical protein n=1 Tax=unclassified Sphingopyxis TaxID=2614943 RepID=UPI00073012AD|nr:MULTISPECIES: hypothetical protein [unclassified Sphingopyxis]KTE06768.1 hypothetical protein ATE76_18460 [Sphingopyxis sp. H093]KTE11075.1 hypothetical protein ATE70_08970 [Sphingopyxis sp. H053]KTE30559.1 hypothetical protein ATE75_02375 [Sphingopyxis sp. H080]KTE46097.1 hypothetical protein ATE77_04315 [Sphingopyxis sp. H005]